MVAKTLATDFIEETGIANLERYAGGGGMLNIKWRWMVLCVAIAVVVCVAIFTDELDPQTIERFSVDAKRWEHAQPTKMNEEEEERAGLGHHVHTFHGTEGEVHASNKKGKLPVQQHVDIEKHLSGPGLDKYQFPHGLPEAPPPEALLSGGKPVETDVRGNLGPGSTIVDSKNADWIRDRWQAAKDMTGAPIPGEHWIRIDLEKRAQLTRVVLDWETAYGKAYDIEVSDDGESGWKTVYTTTSASGQKSSDKHVVHSLVLGGQEVSVGGRATQQEKIDDDVNESKQGRFVRVTIKALGTPWGASLWEVKIFGMWV